AQGQAQPLEHAGVEFAQAGYEEADRIGQLGFHRGRQRVLAVVEAVDRLLDLIAIGGPDALSVEIARYGADRDAGGFGDVDDGRRALTIAAFSPSGHGHPFRSVSDQADKSSADLKRKRHSFGACVPKTQRQRALVVTKSERELHHAASWLLRAAKGHYFCRNRLKLL